MKSAAISAHYPSFSDLSRCRSVFWHGTCLDFYQDLRKSVFGSLSLRERGMRNKDIFLFYLLIPAFSLREKG